MKAKAYPFVPSSVAQMEDGMFWDIPLASGRFSAGIVLQRMPTNGPGSRSMFCAGLIDWSGDAPPASDTLQSAKLIAQGFVHLRTITRNRGLVRGKVDLGSIGIEPILMRDSHDGPNVRLIKGYIDCGPARAVQGWRNLPVAATWGFGVIKSLAEKTFDAPEA